MAYAVVSIGMVCAFAHAEGGVLKARPALGGGAVMGGAQGSRLRMQTRTRATHPAAGFK